MTGTSGAGGSAGRAGSAGVAGTAGMAATAGAAGTAGAGMIRSCNPACASVEQCVDGVCRAECGDDTGPLASVACPKDCDACEAGVCIVRCNTEQACKGRRVNCPEGLACQVECSAKQACETVEVRCAPDQLCSLTCNGEQACKGAKLECRGARCELLCGNAKQSCQDARQACSPGAACRASCGTGEAPEVRGCDAACNASSCGC
jgi:hypothetical protein